MKYHLAIDIGASGGRHIVGYIQNGLMQLREVYRFENSFKKENGSLVWDTELIFNEVVNGLRACKNCGIVPETVAIDTWGVDYVLLDEKKEEILPAYCYRDGRTAKAVLKSEEIVPFEELYEKTGIQKQSYNTVYQLFCEKESGRLETAKYFLMMPAYLSYKLTGVIFNEYTNCTTTALVCAKTKDWDETLLERFGIEKELLGRIVKPGTLVGDFKEEIRQELGFSSKVVFCPSHDTASAVAACPLEKDSVYISSGTWSLIGTESEEAIISEKSRTYNFANEGGIDYRFRFLKNYMGMWLLQNIRKNLNKSLTYDEMMNLAKESGEFYFIDVNAPSLVAPVNMIEAIKDLLQKPNLLLGAAINSVYHSLANSYAAAIKEIENVTGKCISSIHIVGGGSKDRYLNELTEKYTGKPVSAGPVEATATGNLLSQFIFSGEICNLDEAREIIRKSFCA